MQRVFYRRASHADPSGPICFARIKNIGKVQFTFMVLVSGFVLVFLGIKMQMCIRDTMGLILME